MPKRYTSNVTDSQWALVKEYFETDPAVGGRPRRRIVTRRRIAKNWCHSIWGYAHDVARALFGLMLKRSV